MSVLVDANILLYAKFSDFSQHGPARDWLDTALNQLDPVGIPWMSLLAFARIGTNRRIMGQPLRTGAALAQIKEWTRRSNVWMPEPGARFPEMFEELAEQTQASANLMTDTYLAAVAREHGLTVVSTDADFARFPKVKWFNPVAGKG